MGQEIQDRKNLQYLSFYFLKGNSGMGWEIKVSKLPFPNGYGIWIVEEIFSKKVWMDFQEIFSIDWEKTANLGIENLPVYDSYKFLVAYYERELVLNFLKHPQHDLIQLFLYEYWWSEVEGFLENCENFKISTSDSWQTC